MKWSLRLGRFAGIAVEVHVTFFLILAFVLFSYLAVGQGWGMAMEGVAFILAIFACVLLHEFGHALTAKRYGIRTRDITLYPIGGVARLERMPEQPIQELWVALAGPAVNVAIALLLAAVLLFTDTMQPLSQLSVAGGPFLERLMLVNIYLVAFNLLPAFPMDGGRVLRALLAMRLEYTTATQVAASLGQAMAFLFGFVGLFTNPLLLFIAFFVWIGAAQEAAMVQMRTSLGGIPVVQAMITDFRALDVRDPLQRAVDLILAGTQHDFPVVDEQGAVKGILTRADMMKALAQEGPRGNVAEVMQREFETAEPAEMLEAAFARLQSCACHTLPILHNGRLVGLLTADNVGEFIMIQSALSQRKPPLQRRMAGAA